MFKYLKYFIVSMFCVIPCFVYADVFTDGDVSFSLETYKVDCMSDDILGYNSKNEIVYAKSKDNSKDYDYYKVSNNSCVKLSDDEVLEYYNRDYYSGLIADTFEIENNKATIKKQNYFYYYATTPCDEECVNEGLVQGRDYFDNEGNIIINPDPLLLSTYYVFKSFKYPNSTMLENIDYYDSLNKFAKIDKNLVNSDDILKYRILTDLNGAFEEIDTISIDNKDIIKLLDDGYIVSNFMSYNEFNKKGYFHLASQDEIMMYDTDGNKVGVFEEIYTVSPDLMNVHFCDKNNCFKKIVNNDYKVVFDKFKENESFHALRYKDYITYGVVVNDNDDEVFLAKLYTYKLLSGNNRTYNGKDLTFKFSAPMNRVSKVYVEEKELSDEYYNLKSGSTLLTLNKSYLDTLKEGTYNLKIEYIDGASNSAVFNVNITNPQTGDNIISSIIIFVVSIFSVSLVCIYMIKKKNI